MAVRKVSALETTVTALSIAAAGAVLVFLLAVPSRVSMGQSEFTQDCRPPVFEVFRSELPNEDYGKYAGTLRGRIADISGPTLRNWCQEPAGQKVVIGLTVGAVASGAVLVSRRLGKVAEVSEQGS